MLNCKNLLSLSISNCPSSSVTLSYLSTYVLCEFKPRSSKLGKKELLEMYSKLLMESKLLVVTCVLKLSDDPLIIFRNKLIMYDVVHKIHTSERNPPIIEPWSSEKLLWFDFLSRLVVKVCTGVQNKSMFFKNLKEAIDLNIISNYY